jgi:hypothetical protein
MWCREEKQAAKTGRLLHLSLARYGDRVYTVPEEDFQES